MHRLTRWVLLAFSLSIIFTSCKGLDPSEEFPAYITFTNPSVEVDSASGFSSSLGIKDVWLFQNGFLQGVYALADSASGSITIPYIDIENGSFFLEGGVIESGQNASRLPYPFWERLYFDISQPALDTMVVEPVMKYKSANEINIAYTEDFDGSSVQFQPYGYFESDTAQLRRVTDDIFEGQQSGKVTFDSDSKIFQVAGTPAVSWDTREDAWLEISYKTDFNLQVGVTYELAGLGSGVDPILVLLPNDEWNTVYVHIAGTVRERTNVLGVTPEFRVWLYADGAGETGTLRLDMVRLIHNL